MSKHLWLTLLQMKESKNQVSDTCCSAMNVELIARTLRSRHYTCVQLIGHHQICNCKDERRCLKIMWALSCSCARKMLVWTSEYSGGQILNVHHLEDRFALCCELLLLRLETVSHSVKLCNSLAAQLLCKLFLAQILGAGDRPQGHA